jgi:hypothetical protein
MTVGPPHDPQPPPSRHIVPCSHKTRALSRPCPPLSDPLCGALHLVRACADEILSDRGRTRSSKFLCRDEGKRALGCLGGNSVADRSFLEDDFATIAITDIIPLPHFHLTSWRVLNYSPLAFPRSRISIFISISIPLPRCRDGRGNAQGCRSYRRPYRRT